MVLTGRSWLFLLSVWAAIGRAGAAASAADGAAAQPPGPPYKLEQVEYIDRFAGSAAAREMLGKQGFAVTDQQFPQIFSAYLSTDFSPIPKFITVDSAWHTYHVLLEDGVRQVEVGQAGLLRRFSERLYEIAATGRKEAGGIDHDLALLAAVGLALQEPAWVEKFPEGDRATVGGVLAVILGGGPPTPGALFFDLPLTPEQFHPVSFYARTPELSRYFAVRQWYATRVFRLASDAQTLRALRLALLVESDAELRRLYGRLTGPLEAMVGPADDPGLADYTRLLAHVAGGLPAAERLARLKAEPLVQPESSTEERRDRTAVIGGAGA